MKLPSSCQLHQSGLHGGSSAFEREYCTNIDTFYDCFCLRAKSEAPTNKMDELIHSHLNSRSRFVHITFIYAYQKAAKSEKLVTKLSSAGPAKNKYGAQVFSDPGPKQKRATGSNRDCLFFITVESTVNIATTKLQS